MKLVKAINENIVPIQINSEEMVKISIKKYNRIDMEMCIKAHSLVPAYEMFLQIKEHDTGLKRNLWNGELLYKFEEEFTQRYLT